MNAVSNSWGQFSRALATDPLTREEEYRLAKLWQAEGSKTAADRLMRAHLRFVVATAQKYRRYAVPVSELVAEGNFGLAHALTKFDPDKGFRFVTYASYWVRAYILNYIIHSWSMVGGGSGALRSRTFFKLRRERARIAGQVESPEEQHTMLAETMGVSRDELGQMLRRLEHRDVSMDAKVFDDGSSALVDTIASEQEDQETRLRQQQIQVELAKQVRSAVSELDVREQFIVAERLMTDREEKLSLAEIGRKLGVSRERARQLESRAKLKLKERLLALAEDAKPDWLSWELAPAAMSA